MAATSVLGSMLESAVAGGTDPASNMAAFMGKLGDYMNLVSLTGNFASPEGSGPTLDYCDGTKLKNIIVFCSDPGGGDGLSEWTDWINSIYSAIKLNVTVKGGISQPIGNPPAFTTLTLGWSRDAIQGVFNPDAEDVTGPIFDKMAELIIKDLEKGFTATYPANFIGTGTVGVSKVNCP